MIKRIATVSMVILVIIGFTPQSAAQVPPADPAAPAIPTVPIPTKPGDVTWPFALVLIAYLYKDKLPGLSLNVTHTFTADEQTRKCIEENVEKMRRTFRRTFDHDEPPSDDPKAG